jgi:hypothetical protein
MTNEIKHSEINEEEILLIPKVSFDDPLLALGQYVQLESKNLLYSEGKFYWTELFKTKENITKLATATIAGAVGGVGAFYYYPPAQEAAVYLSNQLKLSEDSIVRKILAACSITGSTLLNGLLGAQCAIETAEKMKENIRLSGGKKFTDPQVYLLTNPDESRSEKTKRYGKYSLTAIFTLAYVLPSFTLSLPQSVSMAVLSPMANFSIGVVGVHNLLFKPSYPSYREVFLKYLQEQIGHINVQYEKYPDKALHFFNELKNKYRIEGEKNKRNIINNLEYLIYHLLTFGISNEIILEKETEKSEDEEEILLPAEPQTRSTIQNDSDGKKTISIVEKENIEELLKTQQKNYVVSQSSPSLSRKVFNTVTPLVSTTAAGGYVWSAYKAIRQISPLEEYRNLKIGGGIVVAFLSSVGLVGLSYDSGKNVGRDLLSEKTSLGKAVAPKLFTVLKFIMGILATPSGASNFGVNYRFANEFPILSKIFQNEAKNILSNTYGVLGIIGAPIVNYYYSEQFLQEIVVFMAKFFGQQIREYIESMRFLEKIHKIFTNMNEKHFDVILKKLMTSENIKLRSQLNAIFRERMHGKKYHDLYEKFNLNIPQMSCLIRKNTREIQEELSQKNISETVSEGIAEEGLRRRRRHNK